LAIGEGSRAELDESSVTSNSAMPARDDAQAAAQACRTWQRRPVWFSSVHDTDLDARLDANQVADEVREPARDKPYIANATAGCSS
jgi:hypothetical protein